MGQRVRIERQSDLRHHLQASTRRTVTAMYGAAVCRKRLSFDLSACGLASKYPASLTGAVAICVGILRLCRGLRDGVRIGLDAALPRVGGYPALNTPCLWTVGRCFGSRNRASGCAPCSRMALTPAISKRSQSRDSKISTKSSTTRLCPQESPKIDPSVSEASGKETPSLHLQEPIAPSLRSGHKNTHPWPALPMSLRNRFLARLRERLGDHRLPPRIRFWDGEIFEFTPAPRRRASRSCFGRAARTRPQRHDTSCGTIRRSISLHPTVEAGGILRRPGRRCCAQRMPKPSRDLEALFPMRLV